MSESFEDGSAALARGDWVQARIDFSAALEQDTPNPAPVHRGLADALWWLGETDLAVRHAQDAYAGYRRRSNRVGSVSTAVWLSIVHKSNYHNQVAANGWIARAERLLVGEPPGPLHAWVKIARAYRLADLDTADRLTHDAHVCARATADVDLELVALAQLGRIQVERGEFAAGFTLLEEAVTASLAGEAGLDTVAYTCCDLVSACEVAGDSNRVADWCRLAEDFIARYGCPFLDAECRLAYGSVLLDHGDWDQSAEQLQRLATTTVAPALRATGRSRVARLWIRRGRLEDAAGLLEETDDLFDSRLAVAELSLACGRPAQVTDRLDPAMAPDAGRQADALGLLVEAATAVGDPAALTLAAALRRLAETTNRPRIGAAAAVADGRVALLRDDRAAAVTALTAGERLLVELDLPYVLADCRLALARAWRLADPGRAVEAARDAWIGFHTLDAAPGTDRAAELLRALGVPTPGGPRGHTTLTDREQQVLVLLGRGLSNPEIAARLHISRKTVAHHVSRVLTKLSLRNRAAAAAYTAGREWVN